jgi:hypothetical protein
LSVVPRDQPVAAIGAALLARTDSGPATGAATSVGDDTIEDVPA